MTLAQKLYETGRAHTAYTAHPMLPWERLHATSQAHYEQLAETAVAHLTGSDAATLAATVDQLADVLAELVKLRKGGEFSKPDEQAVWRRARALVVELGR